MGAPTKTPSKNANAITTVPATAERAAPRLGPIDCCDELMR
jgi:hypothetical protein